MKERKEFLSTEECIQGQPEEKNTHTITIVKKKPNIYLIIAIVIAVLVAAIAILTALYFKSVDKAEELNFALSEAEEALRQQEKLTEDLQALNAGQKSEIEKLQEKVEEFLNIEETEPVITSQQLKEQLSAISELVTQKYIYTNADRAENNKTWILGWDMPLSTKSLLVKYDGIIKAGIDFSKVTIVVNEETRAIIVTLPDSKVTDNNVPQETVEVYETNSLFNKVTIEDSNDLIAVGKRAMEEKAIERGLLRDAKEEAKTLIRAFLSMVPGIDTYTLIVQ